MGKTSYVFYENMKKTVGTGRFLMVVLATVVLCFLIPIPASNNSTFNAFMLILPSYEKVLHTDVSLNFLNVMGQIRIGYFIMFTPLLVGLIVLPILCEDWETGTVRYMLVRGGRKKVLLGKLVASLVCGGLVIMAGYLLTGFFLFLKLLHCNAEMEMAETLLTGTDRLQTALHFLSLAAGVFAYGSVCALWTYLVSAFVRNRYLLACTPYIILWFLERLLNTISFSELRENSLLLFFVQMLSANWILAMFQDLHWCAKILTAYVVLGTLAFRIQIWRMNRRTDCGR